MNDDNDDDADDTYGAVAQLVAQRIVSAKVAGSSPVCSAMERWSSLVQDVGLSRRRSRVQIPYAPPFSQARSSVARAPLSHGGGRGFESLWAYQHSSVAQWESSTSTR